MNYGELIYNKIIYCGFDFFESAGLLKMYFVMLMCFYYKLLF